jgi:hypothetical protein
VTTRNGCTGMLEKIKVWWKMLKFLCVLQHFYHLPNLFFNSVKMNQNKFPLANLYLLVITHQIIKVYEEICLWVKHGLTIGSFSDVNSHSKVIVCYVDGWSA